MSEQEQVSTVPEFKRMTPERVVSAYKGTKLIPVSDTFSETDNGGHERACPYHAVTKHEFGRGVESHEQAIDMTHDPADYVDAFISAWDNYCMYPDDLTKPNRNPLVSMAIEDAIAARRAVLELWPIACSGDGDDEDDDDDDFEFDYDDEEEEGDLIIDPEADMDQEDCDRS